MAGGPKETAGRKAVEQVSNTLRAAILSGSLQGGTPMREQDIAERLGFSRTPVREALGRLVTEGLLVKDDNRTAYVFQPSLDELLEIYEIRLPLESMAARIACEAATPEYLRRVRDTAAALEAERDLSDWFVRRDEFHLALIECGRRPRLEAMVRTLRAQSEPYVRFAVATDRALLTKVRRGHTELARQALAGNCRGVESTIKAHLKRTVRVVATLLSSDDTARFPQLRSDS